MTTLAELKRCKHCKSADISNLGTYWHCNSCHNRFDAPIYLSRPDVVSVVPKEVAAALADAEAIAQYNQLDEWVTAKIHKGEAILFISYGGHVAIWDREQDQGRRLVAEGDTVFEAINAAMQHERLAKK